MDPRRVIFDCTTKGYVCTVYDSDGEEIATVKGRWVPRNSLYPHVDGGAEFHEHLAPWPDLQEAVSEAFKKAEGVMYALHKYLPKERK